MKASPTIDPQIVQTWLQRLIDGLGRSDIGIGDVRVNEPRLEFTLHQGRGRMRASLPLMAFFDRGNVLPRIRDLIVAFNKGMIRQYAYGRRDVERDLLSEAPSGRRSRLR